MNQQEAMMDVQEIARQAEQIEQHCGFLDQQAEELEKFKLNLDGFNGEIGSKMMSSFGKGVFIETELKSNNLLVEVGAGIIVRKDKEEVLGILAHQINSLKVSRAYFGEQFEILTSELQKKMSLLDNSMQSASKT